VLIPAGPNPTAITQHLVIANAQSTDAGSYHCVIRDGCVAQGYAFTPKSAVTVTSNPIVISSSGQPVGGGRLVGGEPKTFTVVASGGEPGHQLTAEWFKAIDAVGNGAVSLGSARNMADIGGGLFESDYTITTLPAIADTGFYYAKLTDSIQIISSTLAQYVVGERLDVVSTPQGGYFHYGDAHNPALSVQMTGGVGGITYAWYRNGVLLPVSSPTYNLTPLDAVDSGTYQVSVRDVGIGDGPLYALTPTYAGTLDGVYVSPGVTLTVGGAPLILPAGQPQHHTGPVNGNYTFTVGVLEGTGPLEYRWFQKVTSGADPEVGTGTSFTISQAQPDNQGLFYCVVNDQVGNQDGTVTSVTARLTLAGAGTGALSIFRQPANVQVQVGSPFTLSVLAAGGASMDYTFAWTKNGLPISGADQGALVVTQAALDDQGTYQVTVYSGTDFVVSNPVTVTILEQMPLTSGLGLLALAALSAMGGIVSLRRKK
jgi:hypothetical protein